jgi:hypothetical protein
MTTGPAARPTRGEVSAHKGPAPIQSAMCIAARFGQLRSALELEPKTQTIATHKSEKCAGPHSRPDLKGGLRCRCAIPWRYGLKASPKRRYVSSSENVFYDEGDNVMLLSSAAGYLSRPPKAEIGDCAFFSCLLGPRSPNSLVSGCPNPRERRPPLRQRAHGRVPPAQGLHRARHHLSHPDQACPDVAARRLLCCCRSSALRGDR